MENQLLLVLLVAAVVPAAVLWGLSVLVRKLFRLNRTRIPAARYRLQRRHYDCPQCGQRMKEGFTFFGRGVLWVDDLKKFNAFSIGLEGQIPNTMNLGLRMAGNAAWRCESCQLALVDHSTLVVSD